MTASPGELDSKTLDFIDRYRDVVLFCRDAAGQPIGYPMRTMSVGAWSLLFTSYKKSAKIAHIQRDPRMCVFVPESPPGPKGPQRWLNVSGVARVFVPEAHDVEAAFESTPSENRVPAGMSQLVKDRLLTGKRVLISLEHLRSDGIRSREPL